MSNAFIKFIFWSFLITSSACTLYYFDKERELGDSEKEVINTLKSLNWGTQYIFFIGSSRVQRSVNSKIIQDSITNFQILNLGLSGSTLAQNLFLVNYLQKLPGRKVFFIELSPFQNNIPKSFINAARLLRISDFPQSYFAYIGKNQLAQKPISKIIEDVEIEFWDKLLNLQNFLKMKILKSNYSAYKAIGYSPTSKSMIGSQYLMFNSKYYHNYSAGHKDTVMMNRIRQILLNQRNDKIIFFIPTTFSNENEISVELPVFYSLPINSKWEYDNQLLREIDNPANLENKNHMNSRGAYIYSQGIIKYIKANEKNWK